MGSNTNLQCIDFVDDIARLMQRCDFLIGKPGPNAVAEAIQMGLPVLLEANKHTMLQEQSVLEWVVKHQLGLRFSGPEDILVQLKQLLSPSKLKCYQQHIACLLYTSPSPRD